MCFASCRFVCNYRTIIISSCILCCCRLPFELTETSRRRTRNEEAKDAGQCHCKVSKRISYEQTIMLSFHKYLMTLIIIIVIINIGSFVIILLFQVFINQLYNVNEKLSLLIVFSFSNEQTNKCKHSVEDRTECTV